MNVKLALLTISLVITALPASAEDGRLQKWRELREHRATAKKAVVAEAPAHLIKDTFGGRDILVHIAPNAPAPGRRALVVALHGGMGNANQFHSVIGAQLDEAANEGGFVVAYLNGSRASRMDEKFRAWNAGGECCGQPYKQNVDDVAYITGAVAYLAQKYGVDRQKVYGIGHSNGAMMTHRLMCETNLYQAAIPVAGPLMVDAATCPPAKEKRIWAIHGEQDENVPIQGGVGTRGVTNIQYKSAQAVSRIFEQSGANYRLDILPGVDHSLKNVAKAIEQREQRTFGREAALFFGLAPK